MSYAIVAVFAIFGAVVWKIISAAEATPAAMPQLLVALASFGAAFIAAIVTLIGLLLKTAFDQRTEQRAQAESEHNRVLQRDAEARLKLEASVHALKLLVPQGDEAVPHSQMAGSLLTLSSLNQHELVLTLLRELLPAGILRASAAADAIDRLLTVGPDSTINGTLILIRDHAERLIDKSGFALPYSLIHPVATLRRPIRDWGPILIGRVFMARRRSEWLGDRPAVVVLLKALIQFWEIEAEEMMKNDVAAILATLLKAFPDFHKLRSDFGWLDLDVVRAALNFSTELISNQTFELIEAIELWKRR